MIAASIPKESNIDFAELKIPRLFNETFFAVTLICNTSVSGFYKTPSALSVDMSSKSKLINFFRWITPFLWAFVISFNMIMASHTVWNESRY